MQNQVRVWLTEFKYQLISGYDSGTGFVSVNLERASNNLGWLEDGLRLAAQKRKNGKAVIVDSSGNILKEYQHLDS